MEFYPMNNEQINSIVYPLRKDFLKIAEEFREAKIIGKSEELAIHIIWGGDDPRRALWHGEFFQSQLKCSWVEMSYEETPGELSWNIRAWNIKIDPSFCQCTRCFLYHINKDNYDNLCTRCLKVMLQGYADHPMMDTYFEQRPHLHR